MKINKFRITNFRSIIDTKWRSFSPDGVTVLVGQNESGKSAILEALSLTFSQKHITDDDLRYGCDFPEIRLEIEFDVNEVVTDLNSRAQPQDIEKIANHFSRVGNYTQAIFRWELDEAAKTRTFAFSMDIAEPELSVPALELLDTEEVNLTAGLNLSHIVADSLFSLAPAFTLFQSNSGLLPNTINIDSEFNLVGDGKTAAENLLTIANIELKNLLKQDSRAQESQIARAVNEINHELKDFWNQTIGTNNKIKIEFNLKHHDKSSDTAGEPYLIFLVSDGLHKLHPKQRSAGVRWFLSFYLQLKASQKNNNKLHFLLDEPGANLHANAQKDVLKLINTLGKEISITYSTHSPTLIEYEKLYRVYAIQRANDNIETPTEMIEALHLGAASSDTLSPILTAIGTDFSHQNVIQKQNNIILEEPSAFYYFKSFWHLEKRTEAVNFIAATGANKIPPLAYMFTGWGINYSIIIDDDNQGRAVFNQLKKELWGDNDKLASKMAHKIKDCNGIEDIFSASDFNDYILDIKYQGELERPSDVVKLSTYSKPILAYKFYLKVKNEEITMDSFDKNTISRIKILTNKVVELVLLQKKDQ